MHQELQEQKNPLEMVKFMWAAKFGLPPNDERLLRLTAREALEQVNGVRAIEKLAEEASKENPEHPDFQRDLEEGQQRDTVTFDGDIGQSRAKVGTGSKSIADTPHLTGDPEWDALELAETEVGREDLRIVR